MAVIWKGHISFGLVSIPVEVYSAEKRTELHFHLLDSRNKARIHYSRINDETGKEVPWDKIVKAFEYSKDKYVILDDADFKQAAPAVTKTIDIESFVNINEIDYVFFEKPYYLVPEKTGEKGYILLRETLKKTKKVGIAKVVIREKQYLAAILPVKNAILLNLLRFNQEIRPLEDFHFPDKSLKTYRISDKEIAMAEQLVKGMSGKWEPEAYHDDYREKLLKWIEKKRKTRNKTVTAEKEVSYADNTIDFMAALKKSLESVKHAEPSKKARKQSK